MGIIIVLNLGIIIVIIFLQRLLVHIPVRTQRMLQPLVASGVLKTQPIHPDYLFQMNAKLASEFENKNQNLTDRKTA